MASWPKQWKHGLELTVAPTQYQKQNSGNSVNAVEVFESINYSCMLGVPPIFLNKSNYSSQFCQSSNSFWSQLKRKQAFSCIFPSVLACLFSSRTRDTMIAQQRWITLCSWPKQKERKDRERCLRSLFILQTQVVWFSIWNVGSWSKLNSTFIPREEPIIITKNGQCWQVMWALWSCISRRHLLV